MEYTEILEIFSEHLGLQRLRNHRNVYFRNSHDILRYLSSEYSSLQYYDT